MPTSLPGPGSGMTLRFSEVHPLFGALVDGTTLNRLEEDAAFEEIRRGLDRFAVLVFRNQPMTGVEQVAFAKRLDGELHTVTTLSVLADGRSASSALTEISNVGDQGRILQGDDRRRVSSLGNRLWHTDASFRDPAGRYSMLSAKVVPPIEANTEFADMRAAYDSLGEETRLEIASLRVHHSVVYSRGLLGFDFTEDERARLPGAEHPLVRTIPGSGRRSLYVASHASHIVGLPVPEGRLMLMDLMEHATQKRFVYSHAWLPDDFVIWDNRATMHRAQPFDDKRFARELRRTTTLDLPATH